MFLDDAQLRTASWRLRHSPEAIKTLGVWRWKGIQQHMDRILELCCGRRVIDFGGADGPLGLGSTVVDLSAERKTLDDVPGPVDVIFTSHCLEHVDDLGGTLAAFYAKLSTGGHVIIHVPAYTCGRWRAGCYASETQTKHLHNFSLSLGAVGVPFTPIDLEVGKLFGVIKAEYCGDNSIFIIGQKCD